MKRIFVMTAILLAVSNNVLAQKPLNTTVKQGLLETSSSYTDAYAAAATEVVTIKVKFILANQGALTKKEVLEEYNSTIGKSFGQAKTYEEAVKAVEKKGFAYMHIKGLYAYSQALKDKAIEMQQN